MIQQRWTWDPNKSQTNKAKHGLTFDTAVLVFSDPFHQTYPDPYEEEERWRTFGLIQQIMVVVIHTDPVEENGVVIESGRIISARRALRRERLSVEEQIHG